MSKREPARIPVKDQDTEKALDELRRAVIALARDPSMNARTLDVTLADATLVSVKHGLGRPFTNYSLAAPRGATSTGRIVETAPDTDRLTIYLTATGYGAPVTVRMTVW